MANLKITNPQVIGKLKLLQESTSKALQVNASGELEASTITITELGHLSGVSSAIQTQISAKADSSALTTHTSDTSNPHSVTATQVGLGNVDNTSDANKPVSTAQQTALDLKAPLASPTFTGTVSGVSKSMVGLGNVDNTSDASKPVSTAQQTALDGKADTTLSNLGTTAINTDLVPASDASADLGTVSKRWGATYAQTLGVAVSSAGESIQVSSNGITKYESSDPLTSNNTLIIKAADTTDNTFVHNGGSVQIEAGNAVNGLSAGDIDIIVGVGDNNNGNINFKNKDAANAINSTNYIQIAPGGSVTSIANSIQVIAQVGYADLVSTASDVRLFPATGHAVRVDSKQIKDVADPTANQDAATKLYVDTAVSGAGAGTFVPLSQVGAALGVAGLDSGGKVPAAQLPSTLMNFKGAWNATTNTPTLADGTGTNGDVYRTSVAGSAASWMTDTGPKTFGVGDFIIYNGTVWEHSPASDAVTSVNGYTGTVSLTASDVGLGNVTNTSDANKPVSTAQQTALDLKANIASPTFTGTVSGISATMVGLGNVDNTSDATKNAASVTLTNKTISASSNTISNLATSNLASGVLNTSTSLTSASDTQLPSALAVKSYVDSQIGVSSVAGDIALTSFSAANNQSTVANVTGLVFSSSVTHSFKVQVSTQIVATTNLDEAFELMGVLTSAGYVMSSSSVGDNSGVVFSITSGGQVQYTSANSAGFISNHIKFRATVTNV